MGDFTADWLALREPVDARSRDGGLARLLATWISGAAGAGSTRRGLRVLDLGCGSGANLRALAPALGSGQRWTAVDHDPDLLARLPEALRGPGWSAGIATRRADLGAADWPGPDWPEADLVTGSALLDLVSEAWLQRLVERHRGAAFHFALSVDDRLELTPGHEADAAVFAAFSSDLRSAKGFGPALGGSAPARAEALLRAAGLQVASAASDWKLGAEDHGLAAAWLAGVATAGTVKRSLEERVLSNWLESRFSALEAGELRLLIGHRDLLALPL